MNETEARTFRAAYDGAIKRYSRMTKRQLIAEEAALRADRGLRRVFGGPVSKEEFLRAVLDLRGYTVSKLNEAIHVTAHEIPWPDCPHCQQAAAIVPTGTGWPVGR